MNDRIHHLTSIHPNILDLPEEVVWIIFNHLNHSDVCSVAGMCCQLRSHGDNYLAACKLVNI